MSSWCDKLGSTATVGLRLDWRLFPTETILSSIGPALDQLRDGDRASFNIEKQGAFDLTINSNDGYNLSFDQAKFSATFRHTLQLKNVSGAPPTAKMISVPKPYTTLISDLHKKLAELVPLVPSWKSRTIERIGIVSTTNVDAGDIPPGVGRLIVYMGRPWGGRMDFYNFSLSVALGDKESGSDRCIVAISRVEGQVDDLVTINLDWQRTLKKPRALTVDNLSALFRDAEKASTEYFENIGEGGMFDEELIRSTEARSDTK